jgi:hypothetical protein
VNLGDFKSELRDKIKKGDSFDEKLGGYSRRAARWIEQNQTLQYMRRRVELDATAGEVVIPLPTNMPIKAVEYIRFTAADGTRLECQKGELSDPEIEWHTSSRYSSSGTLNPSHFYLDGVEALIFNQTFPVNMTGVGIVARYSDFPMRDNETHWLLNNAEGLMLRQAMIEYMTDARDDRGYQSYILQREQDLKVLLTADYEMRYAGQDLQLGI